MNKDSVSLRNSDAYTSPGTLDYKDNNGKGFQRRPSVNVLMPINNGRTTPSKWDDAERWITSPVSGSGACKNFAPPPPQTRTKAKSGPLGPIPWNTNNIFAGSPLTTGVFEPSRYSSGENDALTVPAHNEYKGSPSELYIESLYPDSQGERGNRVTCDVSRRDMSTQMSPTDSPESSLAVRGILSASPPPVELNSHHCARVEVRDVQVDKRVTMTKQSEIHKNRMVKNETEKVNDPNLTWNPTNGAMKLSKLQKEEARITAWENLQIAKAEASIRKLEMKLEKKKSKSMDKIMNKLRIAQMKAQEMRNKMSANEAPTSSLKVMSLHKYLKIYLTSCFCFKQRDVLEDKGEAVNMHFGGVS